MTEYTWTDGIITHIYTEDGKHIVEHDENFDDDNEMTPDETEDDQRHATKEAK